MTAAVTLERKGGFYEIEGVFYPSVTTILQVINKPALLGWYAKLGKDEADRVKQESADFGKTVHELIHVVLSGGLVDYDKTDEVVGGCLRSFEEWVRLVEFQPILMEQTVHSKTHQFAGTLDAVGTVYGVPVICDWKTSSGFYPEFWLQTHAYAAAVREMEVSNPQQQLIVRFDKKDKRCYVRATAWNDSTFQAFLAAKTLWEHLNASKGK